MRKLIELDDVFPTGEPTVQPILVWGGGRRVDTSRVTKYASAALDYIKNVSPEPGKTILLLNALGAEETYGPNRNGDGFPEFPVTARGKVASAKRAYFVSPDQVLTKHYTSFKNAHAFKHHVNKDPAKASGKVKEAFWNPKMHRVELLVSIDNDKDPEWVERVTEGEFVPVSMGCRIKYDVCARCGNEAPTRADYCDHVKFNMNGVDADGFKDYVHNPSPDFFDISRVFRPADKTGYTLKKVAEVHTVRLSADLGEALDQLALKGAAISKISDIDKIIRAEPSAAKTENGVVKRFKNYAGERLASAGDISVVGLERWPIGDVLKAAAEANFLFKDAEFIQLWTNKQHGHQVHLPSSILAKTAAASRWALSTFADVPEMFDQLIDSGVFNASTKTASELSAFFNRASEKRGYLGQRLFNRIVPEGTGMRPDSPANTDLLHVGPYATTRGAAIRAQDAVTRSNLKKTLAGGALALGGYHVMKNLPGMGWKRFPVGLGLMGAGAYTALSRPRKNQMMMSDEGVAVPDITELAKTKQASQEFIVNMIECADSVARGVDFSRIKVSSSTSMDEVAQALAEIIFQ